MSPTTKQRPKTDQPAKVTPAALGRLALRAVARLAVPLTALVLPRVVEPEKFSHGYAAGLLAYYSQHLAFVLIVLVPVACAFAYSLRNYQRQHPPRPQRGRPRKLPQPALPSVRQVTRDLIGIVANLDHPVWRLIYLAAYLGAVWATVRTPLDISALQALPGHPDAIRAAAIAFGAPLAAYGLIIGRVTSLRRHRLTAIESIYAVARDTLVYPKPNARVTTKRQQTLLTPHLAVDVRTWRSLTEPDEFFITAPEELSVDDMTKWDAFDVNLNAKHPRSEEWRVKRDPRGRGATVTAASYPTAVLWDGEYERDPLSFLMGLNLETGDIQTLTLGEVSPHVAISGGTSSGKALDLASALPTPSGWRTVGDIGVGDSIFDEAGAPARVTAMSDVEVKSDAFRVTFHDGTAVDVDGEHLWTTYDRAARRVEGRPTLPRARKPWLSEEQRSLLAAELAVTEAGDDISVPEVARLLGVAHNSSPLVEAARAIGVSRTRQIVTTFTYADTEPTQVQTRQVFDRTEIGSVVAYFERSLRASVRERASAVAALESVDEPLVTVAELVNATGMDRQRVLKMVKRSEVSTLRAEQITVSLRLPADPITRPGVTASFYPKRALLEALVVRGGLPLHDQRALAFTPQVRTTREIAETLGLPGAEPGQGAAQWANHSVLSAGPVQYPAQPLPLDPYVLGAWVGEGPVGGEGGWTSEDPEVVYALRGHGLNLTWVRHTNGRDVYRLVGFAPQLEAAGVGDGKRIPDAYLLGSVEQRLALLQGMLDTAGGAARSGTCQFTQKDEALARQVRTLVASLGMVAHLRSEPMEHRTGTGSVLEYGTVWTVSFVPTMAVFRLTRKASLVASKVARAKSEHRYIVSVEPIAPVPMRCLMVDSDTHQFLVTDQYVATHNTSLAEVIAAQVLIKPMPWDSTLHGQVHIVDPKGPFARRWRGRPGVVVSDGSLDHYEPDANGDPVTGPTVMSLHMDAIEAEHKRRAKVLSHYPDVGTWIDLPDEVKKTERFAPLLVILDEYIDHTDQEKSKGDERIEQENDARDNVARLASWHARKYRNVGMHTILIAQRVNMQLIGNVLMSNLPVRVITGQMDAAQTQTMFQTTEVPALPSTRVVYENGERRVKTIPGRARIMNAIGQAIHKVQVMWFGGKANSETLDKWLPRGEVPLNGDFNAPEGEPRKASDFDDDGNLVSPGAGQASDEETPAVDGSGDADGDGVPDGADVTGQHPGDPDDTDVYPEPDSDLLTASEHRDVDGTAVFPVVAEEVPCSAPTGCGNDAGRSCANCGNGFCDFHLDASPDPDEPGLFCADCNAAHPLVLSGAAGAYRLLHSMSRAAGLVVTLTTPADDKAFAVVTTASGRKVIEVSAAAGTVTATSRSGQVEGDEVDERIRLTLATYVNAKQEAAVAAEKAAAAEGVVS